ncbi:RNA polymerase factor sigma-54 [Thalassobacillus pellis]|uniref:RNA polymerase factor sigma-54 n=1 Tax=Thalassobacillus pellis TaxID=748008 RepID=UPI001960D2C3|nr:RNA polymerase factor sigma-54 [Thalassobacillus pellis]MBM7552039.1 RNA polymerase sigma-54 factor [Thalassobacillus pellis]
MELGLKQRQTMKITMTTKLRQAISLLQYTTVELAEYIQEQSLENPLIECEMNDFSHKNFESSTTFAGKGKTTQDNLAFISSGDKGIREDLIDQIGWLKDSKTDKELLRYLVLNLDDYGFLPLSVSEIAEQLNRDEITVTKEISQLQQFEPAGAGSRNLREFLLWQIEEHPAPHPLAAQIAGEYLQIFAEKKWSVLAKKLQVTLEDIREVSKFIQTLKHRPFSESELTPPNYLIPDIIVNKDEGEFMITLNDHFLPNVRINDYYRDLLKKESPASQYIKEHLKQATWLLSSIEQRRATILKMTEVLVDKQAPFLKYGPESLQPLTLKEVADKVGVHESTVSRARTNKVIQTPYGCYELSEFFSSKLQADDGTEASSSKVKLLMEQLTQSENKQKPLSDQKIADYFKKQEGITISRRTVAKYREELHIPSSAKRKERT